MNNDQLSETLLGNKYYEKTEQKRRFEAIKSLRYGRQWLLGTVFLGLFSAGWFYPLIGYFIPLCMVIGVSIASVKGRTWCNWMCPRGSFADTYMKAISPVRQIPAVMRSTPTRVGVLAFLMAMLTIQIVRLWPDLYAIGGFFMILLTITTTVGIILAVLIHHRSWCYICPIGTLSNWVGKNRHQLAIRQESCVECKLCEKACPMQLKPHEIKKVGEMSFRGDCLKCGLCVAACPKEALTLP